MRCAQFGMGERFVVGVVDGADGRSATLHEQSGRVVRLKAQIIVIVLVSMMMVAIVAIVFDKFVKVYGGLVAAQGDGSIGGRVDFWVVV